MGPGVDTADYSGAASRGVNISLGTGAAWSDADGWPDDAMDDTFSSIENLVGTKFNDWLAADSGDNRIEGRRGNDWIFGGTDEDTLLGGKGHDYLFGGSGDDVLYGGVGADCLFGDAGDDVLYEGDGPDCIDGGPGVDTVTYAGVAAGVNVSLGEATAGEGRRRAPRGVGREPRGAFARTGSQREEPVLPGRLQPRGAQQPRPEPRGGRRRATAREPDARRYRSRSCRPGLSGMVGSKRKARHGEGRSVALSGESCVAPRRYCLHRGQQHHRAEESSAGNRGEGEVLELPTPAAELTAGACSQKVISQ